MNVNTSFVLHAIDYLAHQPTIYGQRLNSNEMPMNLEN